MTALAHASWLDQLDSALATVSDLLYSWVLMWLLVGAGIFFTIRTRGIQLRHTGAIAASVVGSRDGRHGGITSFQAFAVDIVPLPGSTTPCFCQARSIQRSTANGR